MEEKIKIVERLINDSVAEIAEYSLYTSKIDTVKILTNVLKTYAKIGMLLYPELFTEIENKEELNDTWAELKKELEEVSKNPYKSLNEYKIKWAESEIEKLVNGRQ